MATARLLIVLLLLCGTWFTAPADLFADGMFGLAAAPQVSPSPLVPGKEATVTVQAKAGAQPVKQVQLQVRIGSQVVGQVTGVSLGANQSRTYVVKIAVPGSATGSVALTIWGQGTQIGQTQAQVQVPPSAVGPAIRAMPERAIAGSRVEMRVIQVRSMTLDPSTVMGSTSFQGTITLENAAPAYGTTVTLTSSNASVSVPSSVIIAGGATAASFTGAVSSGVPPGDVTITAVTSGQGGVAKQATLGVGSAVQVGGLGSAGVLVDGPARSCPGTLVLMPGDQCGLEVHLDRANPTGVTVSLSSSSPGVTVPASVSLPATQTRGWLMVTVTSAAPAGPVTITAVRTGPGGVAKRAALSIQASQVSSLALPSRVEPGSTYTGTVGVAGAAGPEGTVVTLMSSNPAITLPGSVMIPAGSGSATFTARVGSAPAGGNAVTITATKAGAGNTVKQTTVSIAVAQVAQVSTPTVIFPGQTQTGSVSLDVTAGSAITVNLISSSPDVTVPPSVTVPAGDRVVQFTTVARQGTPPDTSVTITAVRSGTGNAPKQATITLRLPQVQRLVFNPFQVDRHLDGQVKTATGTLTLEQAAGSGGITVNLTCCGYDASSNLNTMVTTPSTVTVPAGQTTTTFTATIPVEQKAASGVYLNAFISAVRAGQPASKAEKGQIHILYY